MKQVFALLAFLAFNLAIFAQRQEYNSWTITFESPCEFLSIDTSAQNTWEIGSPSKLILDTAYSASNAIITGLSGFYPAGNHSSFDLNIGYFNNIGFPHNTFIEIKHRFDTDTLRDGGYISVSHDNGQSWINILKDDYMPGMDYNNFISNLYTISDTLFNGEYGFSGNSNGWVTTKFSWYAMPIKKTASREDTMIIRFNFISDEIDTHREGWMIDDIRIYNMDVGGGVRDFDKETFRVFPNPITGKARVEFKEPGKEIELRIYNVQGQLVEQKSYESSANISLECGKLIAGIYILKAWSAGTFIGAQKIIVR